MLKRLEEPRRDCAHRNRCHGGRTRRLLPSRQRGLGRFRSLDAPFHAFVEESLESSPRPLSPRTNTASRKTNSRVGAVSPGSNSPSTLPSSFLLRPRFAHYGGIAGLIRCLRDSLLGELGDVRREPETPSFVKSMGELKQCPNNHQRSLCVSLTKCQASSHST